jgi:hypothetical protein
MIAVYLGLVLAVVAAAVATTVLLFWVLNQFG